ncbi:MAG: GntR family transcriptional regulator [Bacteroidetes bacterium]|nr:GntR family transcriptional regulator [Bacteroidota bacterium]
MARSKVAAPLRQEVGKELKSDLANLVFSPGTRLVERELCDRYNVSRTIIREVLRELESEGLVENIPNIGPVVAILSPDEAVQIYEIRGILAGLATRKFVEMATPRDISKVLLIFDRIRKAADKDDVAAMLQCVSDFHDSILDTIKNEPLRTMLDRIHTRVAILRVTTLSSPGRLPNTVAELLKVFEAIEAGNAKDAERAFIDHIESVSKVAREQLVKQRFETPVPKPMKRSTASS